MNGPQHYAEAERLTELATEGLPTLQHAAVIAEAQVHATLALAAATADQIASRGPGDVDPAWSDVQGYTPPTQPPS